MANICLNTWALYNEGIIPCTWYDIQDYEDAIEELQTLQEENGLGDDLEVFVADYEDDELDIISESCDLEDVAYQYSKYDSLSDDDKETVSYLINVHSYDVEDSIDKVDDVIVYNCSDFSDLAYEMVEEGLFGEIADSIRGYLDYEAIGRDLSYDYDLYDGKIYRLD